MLLEISRVSLLLSSSESVRLEVQQTPLTMVTDCSSFSNCPQAIYEELFMKSYSQTSHQSFLVYFDSFYDAKTKEENNTSCIAGLCIKNFFLVID